MNFRLVKINEIKNQKIIHGIYFCNSKDLKKTRYGDDYIVVTLADNTGILNCKLWKNIYFYDELFSSGDIVSVKANPNTYREKIELNLLHIVKTEKKRYRKYGFSENSFLPKKVIDIKKAWIELNGKINKTGKKKNLIKKIYKDYRERIQCFPIEFDIENQIESSFLLVTLKSIQILELLDANNENPPKIDYEVVYSLIYLSNFHIITGYEKNAFYTLNEESINRGVRSVFFDIFKKYKNSINEEDFNILEKIIFDFDSENYKSEKELYSKILSLVKDVI